MAPVGWRCSRCGTVNGPEARSCRQCKKWRSLFDTEESATRGFDGEAFENQVVEPELVETEFADPDFFEAPVEDTEVFEPASTKTTPPVPAKSRAEPRKTVRLVRLAIFLAVAAVWAIANFLLPEKGGSQIAPVTPQRLEKTAGATPQPFLGLPSCDVYVVPLDDVSRASAADLARSLGRRVPLHVCATQSFRLDVALIDFHRYQLNAGFVLARLSEAWRSAERRRPSALIGLTVFDMFSADRSDWRFVFGSGGTIDRSQGYGVISTARMGSGNDRFRRLETMATRYVGFYYYGLARSQDPTSALYSTILGLDDLDRMRPQFSDPPPTKVELRAARERFLNGDGNGSAGA